MDSDNGLQESYPKKMGPNPREIYERLSQGCNQKLLLGRKLTSLSAEFIMQQTTLRRCEIS